MIDKGLEKFMIKVDQDKFNTLTAKQKRYFRIMYAKSGVLFITAAPGLAKSAIMRTIAKKLGYQYFDIRLSMIDEIDVGLFPFRKETEMMIEEVDLDSGEKKMVEKLLSVMSYAIPEWAYRSNQKPTIIHFEELNRAPLTVRNAALQILLERAIGTDFKFNDQVFMVASGNLGDADGTDVEEFDRALNNRLIHFEHSLSLPEWIADFATEHVHPCIVNFLQANEGHFFHSIDNADSSNGAQAAYATPRSWTFLSDYIVANYGMDASIVDFIDDVREIGASYVGSGATGRFIRMLDESMRFGINEIINRYDEFVEELESLNRDKKSELLNELKRKNLGEMNDVQKENIKRFTLTVHEDEAVAYILKVLDEDYKYQKVNDSDNDISEEFLSDERFEHLYSAISEHIPSID